MLKNWVVGLACFVAVLTTSSASLAAGSTRTAPSAAAFADIVVGVANQYAKAHGVPTRLGTADCVQAAPGRYMCSYATTRTGGSPECHLIQAHWTPLRARAFAVTLSGRTSRCGSLRDALAWLK